MDAKPLVLYHHLPPSKEKKGRQSVEVKKMEPKPILNKPPNLNRVAAIDEEMLDRLHDPIAKGTISTISPTSLLQADLVQILFWTRRHAKNLILDGAQIFHTEDPVGAVITP
jgi:hypothetical protein